MASRKQTETRTREAIKHEGQRLHTIMWKFSPEDYNELDRIWNGPHPEDGQDVVVRDEMPPGFPWPENSEEPQLCSPGDIDPEMLNYCEKAIER